MGEPPAIDDLLRRAGLRATGPRRAILGALVRAHRPVSANELIDDLPRRAANEVTVYRTLNALAEAGVAHVVETADRRRLFEVHIGDSCIEVHPHFVCGSCGTVRCFEDKSLLPASTAAAPPGYRVDAIHLTLYGACPRCGPDAPRAAPPMASAGPLEA